MNKMWMRLSTVMMRKMMVMCEWSLMLSILMMQILFLMRLL